MARPKSKTVNISLRVAPANMKKLLAIAQIAGKPGSYTAGFNLLIDNTPSDIRELRATYAPKMREGQNV